LELTEFEGVTIFTDWLFYRMFTMTFSTRDIFTIMQIIMGILPLLIALSGSLLHQLVDGMAFQATVVCRTADGFINTMAGGTLMFSV
jgi:hypothetical protein